MYVGQDTDGTDGAVYGKRFINSCIRSCLQAQTMDYFRNQVGIGVRARSILMASWIALEPKEYGGVRETVLPEVAGVIFCRIST